MSEDHELIRGLYLNTGAFLPRRDLPYGVRVPRSEQFLVWQCDSCGKYWHPEVSDCCPKGEDTE